MGARTTNMSTSTPKPTTTTSTEQAMDLTTKSTDEKTLPPPKKTVYVIESSEDELPSLDITGIYPLTQANKQPDEDRDSDDDADDELTSLHTRPPTPRAPIRPPPKKRVTANWMAAQDCRGEAASQDLQASPELGRKRKIQNDTTFDQPYESTPARDGLDLLARSALFHEEPANSTKSAVSSILVPVAPSQPTLQTARPRALEDDSAVLRLFQERARNIYMPLFRRNIEFGEPARVTGANRYEGITRDSLYHLALSSRKHVVLKK